MLSRLLRILPIVLAAVPRLAAQTACPPGYAQVPLASSAVLVCTPTGGPPAPTTVTTGTTTVDLPIPTAPISYTPSVLVTAGGGFASPNGKFAYYSVSKSIGQSTYATMANQYTMVKGQLRSCALAGLTKEMYQFGPLVLGITGLGGGCEGFSGNAGAAGSAQAFAHLHFGKSGFGAVITAMKGTTSGFQVTLAPTWGR